MSEENLGSRGIRAALASTAFLANVGFCGATEAQVRAQNLPRAVNDHARSCARDNLTIRLAERRTTKTSFWIGPEI
jgi:hypothetical protein